MRWRIGLDIYRIVDLLISKQAADRDYTAFGLADVCKPLPSHMRCMLAPLAVPMLVYYQDALFVWSGCRLCASFRCAPATGSVLARAVNVLLRSAGSSNPSK